MQVVAGKSWLARVDHLFRSTIQPLRVDTAWAIMRFVIDNLLQQNHNLFAAVPRLLGATNATSRLSRLT